MSDPIVDVQTHLETNYPSYSWIPSNEVHGLTSDVSGHIPVEMRLRDHDGLFPDSDIQAAIDAAGVRDKTSYGGCGPIAVIGIMDYFGRYLDYDEIIEDPTSSEQRIAMSTEILTEISPFLIPTSGGTLVLPSHCANVFNTYMYDRDMLGTLKAREMYGLPGTPWRYYWEAIVESIDQGLPVTMFAGTDCGGGRFGEHYTNIYGYESWIGIPGDGGERITKNFIKARLNLGMTGEYYCDADILNCFQVGLITYEMNFADGYDFYASDFAEEFVNDQGGGQYFFDKKDQDVTLSNGNVLGTYRLRTSYIENKYLVLSPKRLNAGIAYLDLYFGGHYIHKLSFTASMWSSREDSINEKFVIQYYDYFNSLWVDHIEIDPYELSTDKEYPDSFTVLFPKNTFEVRFYATHNDPSGDRNKGRICLDNFSAKFSL